MNESLHLSTVARLVEEMLSARDAARRDRILLDAVLELEAAQAAAVWRLLAAPEPDAPRGWRPALERGPADALPPRSQIEGVLLGGLDRNLTGRGVVLHLEDDEVALVLGEVENPDGRVDLLEALMHLGALLAGTPAPPAEGVTAPLPDPVDPGEERPD